MLSKNTNKPSRQPTQRSADRVNCWSSRVIPKISQETLAEMVGTTRSRINFFMNRFRKLGFIEYNGKLTVHLTLLGVGPAERERPEWGADRLFS